MKSTRIAFTVFFAWGLLLTVGCAPKKQTTAQVPVAPTATSAAPSTSSWKDVSIPSLPPFHPAQPKRVELPNGMVIFLQEDHELPMIDGIARIRGGERGVPANKTGLVDIYCEVWRTGGTKAQTGDQLDDFLEQRAAKVETGGSGDSTTVSWSCLKEDFADVFEVFEALLRILNSAPTRLKSRKRESTTGFRAAMTIRSRLLDAKRPSLSMAQIVPMPAAPSTPRSRQSRARTFSIFTRAPSIPTTSFSEWLETSIPPRWKRSCARYLRRGRRVPR